MTLTDLRKTLGRMRQLIARDGLTVYVLIGIATFGRPAVFAYDYWVWMGHDIFSAAVGGAIVGLLVAACWPLYFSAAIWGLL